MKAPTINKLLSLLKHITMGRFHYTAYTTALQGIERRYHCFIIYEGDFKEHHIIVLPPVNEKDPFDEFNSHQAGKDYHVKMIPDHYLFSRRAGTLMEILESPGRQLPASVTPEKSKNKLIVYLGEQAYCLACQLDNGQRVNDCDDNYYYKPYLSLSCMIAQYESRLQCRIEVDRAAYQNPADFNKYLCEIDLINDYVEEVTKDMEGRNRIEVNGAKQFLKWLQVHKTQLDTGQLNLGATVNTEPKTEQKKANAEEIGIYFRFLEKYENLKIPTGEKRKKYFQAESEKEGFGLSGSTINNHFLDYVNFDKQITGILKEDKKYTDRRKNNSDFLTVLNNVGNRLTANNYNKALAAINHLRAQ